MSAIRRWLDPEEKYGLRVTLAAFAVVLLAVPFALITIAVIGPGPVTRFDRHVAIDLNEEIYRWRLAVNVLRVVTRLGSSLVLVPLVAGTAALLWRRGLRRRVVFLVVTAALGSALNSAVKLLVHRTRPVVPFPITTALGQSFPSGHTVAATVCFGAMLIALLPLIAHRWRVPSVVGAALVVLSVGASRVLLGVHFVTDVVAGFILGTAWLAASTATFEIWRAEETEKGHPVT